MATNAYNQTIIDEFRANNGKVAQYAGYPLVILHTVGAKSGEIHLVPLVLIIEDDAMLLLGSAAGAKKHPAWVFNLRANPEITIELGSERFTARLNELAAREAQEQVSRQLENSDQYAHYVETAAPREIPVFRIERL